MSTNQLNELGKAAREAASALAVAKSSIKEQSLVACADQLRSNSRDIEVANQFDMEAARNKGLSKAMLDRLFLDKDRIEAMAVAVEGIALMPDPVGHVLSDSVRPNGLKIQKVSVPLGVIGIIYESRPNVTSDAAALCIKSGNACILRGGSDSWSSSNLIADCMRRGLESVGLNPNAVQRIPSSDRALVGELLRLDKYVDVIVPRGGKSLVARVQSEARVPVFSHLDGICHTYVDEHADLQKATNIVINAKMRRTGICGAMETLLVHEKLGQTFLPKIVSALKSQGCEVRGDNSVLHLKGVVPATIDDWDTEYLDAIVSIAVVPDIETAIEHINTHSSSHTEAIITEDKGNSDRFLREIDSAIVMLNTSTQFADGGEFGLGAEIGISTGRMHARGPVGAAELTTYKYRVIGTGQIRP
ncbi:MAG: glutamate-5-semialdehyde dehydrogenase [Alphaproteobacteria bacterium]